MSFAEFDSVLSLTPAVQDLSNAVMNLKSVNTDLIIISGVRGSGRKTFATYLKKKNNEFSQYQVIESDDINFSAKKTIYITEELQESYLGSTVKVFQIPTLAERKNDLIQLADFFAQVHSLINGKNKFIFSEKAKEKVIAYAWPGQFIQLEQIIEAAVKMAEKNCIEPEHLILPDAQLALNLSLGQKLENVERQYILQTLFFLQQNRTKAADVLGISIRTLRNKLNQYRQEGFL